MPTKPSKKLVFLCFDKSEQNEIEAFISRKIFKANQENPGSGDEIDTHIIYPADVSEGDYMTWGAHKVPTEEEREILQSLTSKDNIYIWGHGAPNYAYLPGASYTEVADFIMAGINKDNFTLENPLKINCEMCNSARGGAERETSFAARFHAYLGKLGLATVISGRLRNVVIDFENIREQGVTTLRREYDAMLHMGIDVSEEHYKHQEPGSKATFAWQNVGSETVQMCQDSYRNILNKKFIKFEETLLKELGNQAYLSDGRIKPDLHKVLLGIKLRINNLEAELNPKELMVAMQECRDTLVNNYHLAPERLTDIGFDTFENKLRHQSQDGGLIQESTGVSLEQPLLPFERSNLEEITRSHPLLKEFSLHVQTLRDRNNSQTPPNAAMDKFLDSVGSEENISDSSLYSDLFTAYRKAMLIANDGEITMPKELAVVLEITSDMLKELVENPKPTIEQKTKILLNYEQKMNKHMSSNCFKNAWNELSSYASGFKEGVKSAWAERHGASIIETIGQVFKTGFEWAKASNNNFNYYKEQMNQIHKDAKETLMVENPAAPQQESKLSCP